VATWNGLLENGVYVNLALPPGTPDGASLLRCSVTAGHSEEDIAEAVRCFAATLDELSSVSPDAARPSHAGRQA